MTRAFSKKGFGPAGSRDFYLMKCISLFRKPGEKEFGIKDRAGEDSKGRPSMRKRIEDRRRRMPRPVRKRSRSDRCLVKTIPREKQGSSGSSTGDMPPMPWLSERCVFSIPSAWSIDKDSIPRRTRSLPLRIRDASRRSNGKGRIERESPKEGSRQPWGIGDHRYVAPGSIDAGSNHPGIRKRAATTASEERQARRDFSASD